MAATREAAVAPPAASPNTLFAKLSPGPGMPAPAVADHQRSRIHAAMVEIAGEGGYGVVTVRELARLAHVSTRTFYQHFSSKEECFLCTQELVMRRILRRLAASQAGRDDWRQRLGGILSAFTHELGHDSRAARLLLVEAYAAGPRALEQARWANQVLGERLAECLPAAPDEMLPPRVADGVACGAIDIARSHLLAGRAEDLVDLGDRLTGWALTYANESAVQSAELDRVFKSQWSEGNPCTNTSHGTKSNDGVNYKPSGDLALLLSAAAKLAASDDKGELTVKRILAAAGVSRRRFYANFEGIEDCVVAAINGQIDGVIARAVRARATSKTWAEGTCRVIASLCADVAGDSIFAHTCLGDGGMTLTTVGMDSHQRLSLEVTRLLRPEVPREPSTDDLIAEASACAMLRVLRREVSAGRAGEVHQIGGTLAYLALAPVIGSASAVATIRGGLTDASPTAVTGTLDPRAPEV